MKTLKTGAAGLALCLACNVQAAVIFQDNFDAENGGMGALNYDGFTNWDVNDGTVDLIGNGYFDFLPGNGLYVDLDGSTGNAGFLTHWESLAIGDYTISFDLAGNQRNGSPELTVANVGIFFGDGVAAQDYISLSQNDGFQTFSLDFSVTNAWVGQSAEVRFDFGGVGGDNIGMLLDNVELATRSVPEPASIALLGLGLAGFGFARRAKKA